MSIITPTPIFKDIILSPKLFFVSTSTTTSTQTSSTFCFVATTASYVVAQCGKRRKKRDLEAITTSGGQGQEGTDKIQPTPKQVCSFSSSFLFHSHIYLGRSGNHQRGEQRGSRGLQTGGQVDELLDDHHHHLDLHQLHCHQHSCYRNLHTCRVPIFNVWLNQSNHSQKLQCCKYVLVYRL